MTNRDEFWDDPANGGDYPIIGIAGHKQGMGFNGEQGKMWNVDQSSGTYQLGLAIRKKGCPVTLFPEDTGDNTSLSRDHEQGLHRCGEGVLGATNSEEGGRRVDGDDKTTDALALGLGSRRTA